MFIRRLKTANRYWVEDGASQMGAALAYYTLFSIAPLLILILAVVGQVVGDATAKRELLEKVRSFIDEDSANAVQSMLDNFRRPPSMIVPALVGTVTLLFGAMGVFTQLRSSLQRIWRLQPPPTHGFIHRTIKNYLVALVMVLLTCIFMLILLTTSTILSWLLDGLGHFLPGEAWVWRLGDFLLSCFLITVLLAFTFRFMSDGRIRYRHLWGGAWVSALLLSLGRLLIGFYLAQSHLGSGYGVAGSLVVFLVWVYYSAQMVFYGAEIVRTHLNPS